MSQSIENLVYIYILKTKLFQSSYPVHFIAQVKKEQNSCK